MTVAVRPRTPTPSRACPFPILNRTPLPSKNTQVPPINLLAVVLSPVGKVLSMFAKLVLRVLGVKVRCP